MSQGTQVCVTREKLIPKYTLWFQVDKILGRATVVYKKITVVRGYREGNIEKAKQQEFIINTVHYTCAQIQIVLALYKL